MELTEKQMHEVSGGVSWGIIAAIAAGLVYIIGGLSGLTKLKWQKDKNIEFIRNLSIKLLIQIPKKG